MKNKMIILFLLKMIISILGIILIIRFSNLFVANAANGKGMNFTYFIYIVLTIFIVFIISPIFLNLMFRNSNKHSISIGLLNLLVSGSKDIVKDTLRMSKVPDNKTQVTNHEFVDDRVIEYFTKARSIYDIKHQKTKLNYPVSVLVSDIEAIVDEVPKLIQESKEIENSNYSNKLFTSSASKHDVKVSYINKHKVEVTSGYVIIQASEKACKNFNDFHALSPYLRRYLKPNKNTL